MKEPLFKPEEVWKFMRGLPVGHFALTERIQYDPDNGTFFLGGKL